MKVTGKNWGRSIRELQEPCEYCEGSPRLYEQVGGLTVDQVYQTIRVMVYPEDKEPTCMYIRMKYCPMCGRELKKLN